MLEEVGGSYSDSYIFATPGSGQSAGNEDLVSGAHEHAGVREGSSVLVAFHGGILGEASYEIYPGVSVESELAPVVESQI